MQMYKNFLTSIIAIAALFITAPVLATSYEEQIKNFYLHGSGGGGRTITFGYNIGDMNKIKYLTTEIRTDQTATSVFEKTLVKKFCRNSKGNEDDNGTVSWNDNTLSITCAVHLGFSPLVKDYFLEAHCAGFCTLHGNGFKKYEYNKKSNNHDCICKSGNARNLNVSTPSESSEPVTTQPQNNNSNNTTPKAKSGAQPDPTPTPAPVATQPQNSGSNTQPTPNNAPANGETKSNNAQTRTIQITVQDDMGPLLNANVKIDGTSTGGSTDANGMVEIKNVPANATTVTVSYTGYKSQIYTIDNIPSTIILQQNTDLKEVTVYGCGPEEAAKLNATKASWSDERNACYPTECKDTHTMVRHESDETLASCVEKRTDVTVATPQDEQKSAPETKPEQKTKDPKPTKPKGDCTPDDANATAGEYKKGKCIITACGYGYHPSKDGSKCEAAELSEEGSKQKIADLKDNAQKMKEKEQSTANKTLGAAAIGATGIGGMQLMSGMAEQNADQSAEEDMKAYLATFVCDYGRGRNIKGGEHNIEVPGGNDLTAAVTEYKTLAADLKVRKEALGKQPGIESEVIIDAADSGLYDNAGIGRQGGAYASLSRALTDETSADAEAWAKQKSDTASKIKTGATVAGLGALGGLAGNLAINSGEKNKNQLNDILNKRKYDEWKEPVKELEQTIQQIPVKTTPCPNGTTGSQAPNCKCTDTTKVFNTTSLQCEECPANEQPNANGLACECKSGYTRNEQNQCTQLSPGVTPQCDTTDSNMKVDPQTGECNCINGYEKSSADQNKCVCNQPKQVKDGLCTDAPQSLDIGGNDLTISLAADSLFDLGKHELKQEAYEAIGSFRGKFEIWQRNNPDAPYCIRITGHTDRTGTDRINNPLSERRATAVQSALVRNGNIIPQNNT